MGNVRWTGGNYLGAHNLVGQVVEETSEVEVIVTIPVTKEVAWEAGHHAHARSLLELLERVLDLDLHHSVHQRLHTLLHLGKHLSDFLKDAVHAGQVELEAWTSFESWMAFVKDLNIFVDLWLLHLGEYPTTELLDLADAVAKISQCPEPQSEFHWDLGL